MIFAALVGTLSSSGNRAEAKRVRVGGERGGKKKVDE